MGNDSPTNFRRSVEWFGKETFIGVGQSSFQFTVPPSVLVSLSLNSSGTCGARQRVWGVLGRGSEALWRARRRGRGRTRGPRGHTARDPKAFLNPHISHFSIVKICLWEGRTFRKDITFAGRKETPKGNHVCGKIGNPYGLIRSQRPLCLSQCLRRVCDSTHSV